MLAYIIVYNNIMVDINVVSTYIIMIQNARTHIFYETIEFYLVPIDHVFFFLTRKKKSTYPPPKAFAVMYTIYTVHWYRTRTLYILYEVAGRGRKRVLARPRLVYTPDCRNESDPLT